MALLMSNSISGEFLRHTPSIDPVTLTWSALNVLTKTRFDAILQMFGSLKEALPQISEEFLRALGCREETVREILMRLEEFDVQQYEARLQKMNIRFLTIEDESYPAILRNLPDPPVFLYALGDLSLLGKPAIALVGTREMTKYGQRVTQLFTSDLVAAGLITVSGLARGVDSEVAKETMRSGGKHIAVLGNGFSRMTGDAEKLSKEIVSSGGLILTEYPLDMEGTNFSFPGRNRLIAGLSKGTVVLEAPLKSGALITAEFALEQGSDVFAVPGPITEATYAGCHQIISKGQAKLVTTAADILEEMGMIVSKTPSRGFESDDPIQLAVWDALSVLPVTADQLTLQTSVDPQKISAALTMMELSGDIRNVGGGQWVRA